METREAMVDGPDDPEVSTGIWDVAVIGAGPAGSAAALAVLRARPDARVVLLDRSEFPRDKTCGDGVAAEVLDVLDRLGAGDLLDGWPRVHRLRLGFPDGTQVVRPLPRPTVIVPRLVLDSRLVTAAVDRGAVLRRHRVRRVDLPAVPGSDRPVTVDGTVRARIVIGADGAHSVVRASIGLARPRPGTTAIAIRAYAPVAAGFTDEQVIAFAGHAAWPAYAWSFPLGDGRANIGYGEALPVRGPGPTRAELLARLSALLPGVGDGATGWRAHHLPVSTGRVRLPDGPVLLAGDAHGLINPLTGEGIHDAVRSGAVAGLAAVHALRRGTPHRAAAVYRAGLRAALGRHQRHMDAVVRLAADPRVISAGLEVAAAEQRHFDTMVRLGLADGTLTPGLVLALIRRGGVAGVWNVLTRIRSTSATAIPIIGRGRRCPEPGSPRRLPA
jgi:geranylgeranyl reductase family protein